ncbi:MAG: hypothetical protein V1492_05500 [Candidatus Micrarchaeota archaeon]
MKQLFLSNKTRETQLPRIQTVLRKLEKVEEAQWAARSHIANVSTAMGDVAYARKLIKFINPSAGTYVFVDLSNLGANKREPTAAEYKTMCSELKLIPDLNQRRVAEMNGALLALDLRLEGLNALERQGDTETERLSKQVHGDMVNLNKLGAVLNSTNASRPALVSAGKVLLGALIGACVGFGFNPNEDFKSNAISTLGGAVVGIFYAAVLEIRNYFNKLSEFRQTLSRDYETSFDSAMKSLNQLEGKLKDELSYLSAGLPELLAKLEVSVAKQAEKDGFGSDVRTWLLFKARKTSETKKEALAARLETLEGEF